MAGAGVCSPVRGLIHVAEGEPADVLHDARVIEAYIGTVRR